MAIEGTAAGATDIVARHARFRMAIEPLVAVAYRVLQRLGVASAELDDAVQQVLVAADRKFDEIPNRAELKAYVCAICVNVARDFGRRRARNKVRNTALDDVDENTLPGEADPADVLERKQTLALIHQILAGMDSERREVFVLYELEELNGREIAEHLGIPAGTVSSRLRAARADFRAAFTRLRASTSHFNRGTR